MPLITIQLETAIRRSFRVEQVAGLFDVPLEERLRQELIAEVPGLDEAWTIGAIVGPSGSGKTTLARAAFGDALYQPEAWPADRAIVDVLGESSFNRRAHAANRPWAAGLNGEATRMPTIKEIARVLTAVGLGSVPTWLKPYRVLSTGERARADAARAVLHARGECLVLDEFTSPLDRTTAATFSAALSRFVRAGETKLGGCGSQREPQSHCETIASSAIDGTRSVPTTMRLVVVTCHDDVLPWLEPDWVVELPVEQASPLAQEQARTLVLRGTGLLSRRRLRRPQLRLCVERVPQAAWHAFARHHYLTGGLARSARVYAVGPVCRTGPGAAMDDELASGRREPPGGARLRGAALPAGSRRAARRAAFPLEERADHDIYIALCATAPALGWRGVRRIARIVVAPEYQGLGIGSRVMETVAAHEAAEGKRITITASHPAIVRHCSRSPRWRATGVKKTGSTPQRLVDRSIRSSRGRAVASFEWVGAVG